MISLQKNRRPVLLVGAGGMLGQAWARQLDAYGAEYIALTRAELDVTDRASVRDAVTAELSCVINCSGYTDVDGAETHVEEAMSVNARGVQHLAAACERSSIPLVHYSTDYVFEGSAAQPYAVDHRTCPINAYGLSKAAGEQHLLAAKCPFLLIRTSWMYGAHHNNFVRTMRALMRDRPSVKVVADQLGRPTNVDHLAASSLRLLRERHTGVFHLTDGSSCTWFEFACAIRYLDGLHCDVSPCTSADFARPAERPGYSVLDIRKSEQALGRMPHWFVNLGRTLGRLDALATATQQTTLAYSA